MKIQRRKILKFLSISLPDEDFETIDKYCVKHNINRSQFIRNIIMERIKKTENKNEKKS